MKYLITGGLGYIGRHTIKELLNNGDEVVVIDDFTNATSYNSEDIKIYKGNIADKELVNKILSENKIDAILHLAGSKYVPESVKKPFSYYNNNISNMISFLEVVSHYDCKNIVFASSQSVYGLQTGVLSETISPLANSPYATTKIVGEQLLLDMTRHYGFKVIVLRYANINGNEFNNIQFNKKENLSVIEYLINKVKNKEEIRIYDMGSETRDGSAIRDFIYIKDIALANVCALKNIKNYKYEIFNVGSKNNTSIKEVISMLERVMKVSINPVLEKKREGDIASLYCDSSKIKNMLGWEAKYSLEDIVTSLK